jgi:glycosyltransferase involved in cell wall biosynthesis
MKNLSIIVPIYNVEPYVEKCLRSLEDQNISRCDYEIICINDGSPDDSRGIVLRMQKEFDNIILMDQENQGVSRARNNGIDKAIGKYIMFIDPDDYVNANSFGRILKNADKQEAQVSFLGFTVLNEDGTICHRVLNKNHISQIYAGTKAYFLARGDGSIDPDRMMGVLFEKSFIDKNNLRYLPDIPYLEDGEFIARILCLAERCIFDGHSFYQRTTRPGSATNSKLFYSEKATNGFLLAASNLKRFQKEQNLNEEQKVFLNQPIVKFVTLAVDSSISWKSNKKFEATIKTLKALAFNRVKVEGCNREYRFCGKAYNLSPWLGALALILYPRLNKRYLSNIIRKSLLTK